MKIQAASQLHISLIQKIASARIAFRLGSELKALAALTLLVFNSGCLQTRSDVRTGEQKQVLQQQVGTLQKTNADTSNRIADLEEQIRFLSGRIEVLENKIATTHGDAEQMRKNSVETSQSQNQKLAIFQDALTKMEQNVNQLQADVAAARAQGLAAEAKKEFQAKEE